MPGKKWTEEEKTYILHNYKTKSHQELAIDIGKTKKAIQHFISNNNLSVHCTIPKCGDKFNRLTVICTFTAFKYKQNYTYAVCLCDCGNPSVQKVTRLISGKVITCGCIRYDMSNSLGIHGGVHTHKLYWIYSGMKDRCNNPNTPHYKNYGGRGIKICAEWDTFEKFFLWATSNEWKEELTLDRIDNDGNYSPKNCRWATYEEQANNKRNTIKIKIFNESKTIARWSRDSRCKCTENALWYRITNNWNPETALITPQLTTPGAGEPKTEEETALFITEKRTCEYKNGELILAFGIAKNLTEWSRDTCCKVDYQTLVYRIKHGWEPEMAITTQPIK